MSIKFIFKADGTEVNNLLAEFKQNAEAVGPAFEKGFVAMGMGAVLELFDRLKSAVGQLGEMFSSCMREAIDIENVATRLGVMLNDSLAGDALASSLQRMVIDSIVPHSIAGKAAGAFIPMDCTSRLEILAKRHLLVCVLGYKPDNRKESQKPVNNLKNDFFFSG